MAYSTPSPSDTSSNWSSGTTGAAWSGSDLDSPVTPSMPYATLAEFANLSVTSHPRAMSSRSNTTSPIRKADTPGNWKQWPQPLDWSSHRDRIFVLYIIENKKLHEVIKVMKSEHNFHATERMYKQRFADWSFRKNMTKDRFQHVEAAASEGSEVDVDEVKKAIKYAKRNNKSTDLKKSKNLKRLVDLLKPLSGDIVKDRSGRAKASAPATKQDKRGSQPPHPAMPWSPRVDLAESVPEDMTQLLHAFVSEEFNTAPYAYACSPVSFTSASAPTPTPQWQLEQSVSSPALVPHMASSLEAASELDEAMLDFTIRFRYAHILLDDGMTGLGQYVVRECLNTLSTCLQQTHSVTSKATTTVLLYVLSAALEMAVSFNHLDVLYMLFRHLNVLCAGQHPTMAEIAGRMPQLERDQQIAMLELMRQMISRASFGYPGSQNPTFDFYSCAVDISISNISPERKLHDLYALSGGPNMPRPAYLTRWFDERMAAAICDAPLAAAQQGIWDPTNEHATLFSIWKHPAQGKKIATVLSYLACRVRDHKMTGNWCIADRMARESAWLAEMGWGHDDAVTRKFRDEAESMKSPGLEQTPQVSVSVPPLQALEPMDSFAQLARLEMVHGIPEMNNPFMRSNIDPPAGSNTWSVPVPREGFPNVVGRWEERQIDAQWGQVDGGCR